MSAYPTDDDRFGDLYLYDASRVDNRWRQLHSEEIQIENLRPNTIYNVKLAYFEPIKQGNKMKWINTTLFESYFQTHRLGKFNEHVKFS